MTKRSMLCLSGSALFVILNEASNGERSEEARTAWIGSAWRRAQTLSKPVPVLLSAKRSISDVGRIAAALEGFHYA
jgi:hypothetical protein